MHAWMHDASELDNRRTRRDETIRDIHKMVAPGWQNKKKKTLKTRDSANARALKKRKGLKAKHEDMKKRVAGAARTGKQRRKALRNERRAIRNKEDEAVKKASVEGGDVEMKE